MASSTTCTKDKKISSKQKAFIRTSLRRLGVNPKHNGFIILQKAIIYAYEHDMITINLYEIYKYLASEYEKSFKTIESLLVYTFYKINIKKLSTNYEIIFGFEYSIEYFNIRSLIGDFVDSLDDIESI